MEKCGTDCNRVSIAGTVQTGFEYSHVAYGEKFYTFKLKVVRLKHTADIIPILVSEKLVDVTRNYEGLFARVEGQFRSYNSHWGTKNKLVLTVFAKDISIGEKTEEDEENNLIILDGFVCKKPVYRRTPFGREITDLLIAVNRSYDKSDYIPCISWGRNAKYAENFKIGTHIKLEGRIQSREYVKREGPDNVESHVAYEVSVRNLNLAEEETAEEDPEEPEAKLETE
ncbi:MAG: single-stranded DNA-binding protein [Lachnospiraceae bacterium]|nr:single-stranded DNA-binding protein [Lachnospiraceae bacterium]